MRSDFEALVLHGCEQELILGTVPALQDLLDDVVAIDVFAHLLDPGFQVLLDQLEVLLLVDYFDDLLYRPRPVSILADLDWVLLERLDDLRQLVLRTKLCDLLDEVVAEAVDHEAPTFVDEVVEDGVEDLTVIGVIGLLQILLEESAATLVLGQCWSVSEQLDELCAAEFLMSFQGVVGGVKTELLGYLDDGERKV